MTLLASDATRDAAADEEEEEWVGEDEAWDEEEEDELLGPRALPVDGEPDFESVRARSARSSKERLVWPHCRAARAFAQRADVCARSARAGRRHARLVAACVRNPRRFGLNASGCAPRRARRLMGWSICAACAGRRRSAPASLAPRSTRACLTGARELLAQPQHAAGYLRRCATGADACARERRSKRTSYAPRPPDFAPAPPGTEVRALRVRFLYSRHLDSRVGRAAGQPGVGRSVPTRVCVAARGAYPHFQPRLLARCFEPALTLRRRLGAQSLRREVERAQADARVQQPALPPLRDSAAWEVYCLGSRTGRMRAGTPDEDAGACC